MMIEDEILVAYADGELVGADRVRLEQALANDPALRERLEKHRRLGARLSNHYQPAMVEPLPDKLTALFKRDGDSDGKVVDFTAARDRKTQRKILPGWGTTLGAIAASLVAGLMAGQMLPSQGSDLIQSKSGTLIAKGDLADALDVQLASAQPAEAAVRIGVSFRDKTGHYCRSFDMATLSGLACRDGEGWQLPVTTSRTGTAASGYRQAGSGNTLIMEAASAMMDGDGLDPGSERAARDRGWR